MNKYLKNKNRIKQEAIEYQNNLENQDYCWGDLIIDHDYFKKQAKRYGLLKEFKENGII